MTLEELQAMLSDRGASATIHIVDAGRHNEFVVWLFAPEDPAVLFTSEAHKSLEESMQQALDDWDESAAENETPPA